MFRRRCVADVADDENISFFSADADFFFDSWLIDVSSDIFRLLSFLEADIFLSRFAASRSDDFIDIFDKHFLYFDAGAISSSFLRFFDYFFIDEGYFLLRLFSLM